MSIGRLIQVRYDKMLINITTFAILELLKAIV